MAQLFTNNAASTLASSLSAGATQLSVNGADADLFPACSAPDFFKVTLEDASGNIEIVKVTERLPGSGSMTVVRGFEGTTPLSFDSGSIVELRLTASDIETAIAHPSANPAHTAAAISYSPIPGGSLISTNVQDAIVELDWFQNTQNLNYVKRSGDSMTGFLVLHAKPEQAMQAANKQYVDDAVVSGGGNANLDSINSQLANHESRIDALEGGGGGLGAWTDKTGAIDITGVNLIQYGPGMFRVRVDYPVEVGSNWGNPFTVYYFVLTPDVNTVSGEYRHTNPNPSGTAPASSPPYIWGSTVFLDNVTQFVIQEDVGGVPVNHQGKVKQVWKL